MSKSPISLLQEVMMKQGCVPLYSEVTGKNVLGINQFTFIVKCNTVNVSGTGPNKKEAKTKAALEMLNRLIELGTLPRTVLSVLPESQGRTISTGNTSSSIALPVSTDPVTNRCIDNTNTAITLPRVTSSSADTPEVFVNYVGRVMEIIVRNGFQAPVYDIVNVSGPPHFSTFTMTCTVGDIKEEATGNSKKAVKQEVSRKILRHLEKIENNFNAIAEYPEKLYDQTKENTQNGLELQFLNLQIKEPKHIDRITEKIISSYKTRTMTYNPQMKDVSINEYHAVLYNFIKNLQLTQDKCMENPNGISNLRNFISSLRQTKQEIRFESNQGTMVLVGIRLETLPTVCEIGIGSTIAIAERHAFDKLCDMFLQFMK